MSESGKQLTASVLTPPGRGAVATIGLRGDVSRINDLFQAVNRKGIEEQPVDRICFGRWGTDPSEEVVLIRTAPEQLEIHCHGGSAAVQRILNDLTGSGATLVSNEAWLIEEVRSREAAECLLALTRATTQRTAHHLLRQTQHFPSAFSKLETLPEPERVRVIERMLRWKDFGLHLTTPWKVVLCGRPNVGKSSLINSLAGFTRSVVFDQPGTTRDVVAVETAIDGWPVELSDTAGIRSNAGELEAAGIELAQNRIREADLVLIVLDATAGRMPEDLEVIQHTPRLIEIWNKVDLVPSPSELNLPEGTIAVSATTGQGLPELMERIGKTLVPHEPDETEAYPVTASQVDRLLALADRCRSS